MKNWLKIFFLYFVLGLLVYFNSLNSPFLIDDYAFLENPVTSDIKYIFAQWDPYREQALGVQDSQQHLGYYRPMAHMVLNFSYATFKNNYWQYHLLNLFLFVLAASLVFLLIEQLTGNYYLAVLAGLLYLIHPINGIVVNYISASVFAFQVLFMLGTLLLLLGSLERKSNRGLYILSLVFCFLSLFWNESGIMTPFYVSAVILLFRKESLKEKVFYLLPYFLIIFSYFVFRLYFININALIFKQTSLYHMSFWQHLATLFQVYAWYMGKLFYPQGIVMQWATPIWHVHTMLGVLGFALLCLIFVLLYLRFSKEKICRLALIWIFIGFAPVYMASFRTPASGAIIEPHWFVFSSIGFFILASYVSLMLVERMKKAGWVFIFIVFFALAASSHAYNRLWSDPKTYASYWVAEVPNLKSTYNYLAQSYQREGDLKKAAQYYRRAISGTPSDVDTYVNLAAIETGANLLKDAESDCKMAIKLNPYSATAYNNLGSIYYAQKQWGKARKDFEKSLALNPLLMQGRLGLALTLINLGQYRQAIDLCLMNLNIVPDDPATMYELIDIFAYKKDPVNLTKYANRFIKSENNPKILTELGIHLAQGNALALAMNCFAKVMSIDAEYKDAYLEMGTLFANSGQLDQAIHIWDLGSSIDPSDERFKKDIERARALRGV